MPRKSKYTEEEFINKCNELGLEYNGFYMEHHKGTVVQFVCNKHRDKGVQEAAWSHFKDAKIGCPYCYGRHRKTKDIIPLIKNKNVELISEYLGCEKPIMCRCKECGYEWKTIPKALTTNGAGCPKCGRKKANIAEAKSMEQFVEDLHRVNPNIEVIGEYVNTHTKIKCRCKIDGTEWYGYPANLLNLSAGCPTCNASTGETELIKVLTELKLNIRQQHVIDGCKRIHSLRFDAYDVDNNIAFEYNGEQHYRPIDFSGQGHEYSENEFKKTCARDNVKRKFCQDNNIPLVVVPYWEKSNMKEYVTNELNSILNTQ